jgi:hypothetical protein
MCLSRGLRVQDFRGCGFWSACHHASQAAEIASRQGSGVLFEGPSRYNTKHGLLVSFDHY